MKYIYYNYGVSFKLNATLFISEILRRHNRYINVLQHQSLHKAKYCGTWFLYGWNMFGKRYKNNLFSGEIHVILNDDIFTRGFAFSKLTFDWYFHSRSQKISIDMKYCCYTFIRNFGEINTRKLYNFNYFEGFFNAINICFIYLKRCKKILKNKMK